MTYINRFKNSGVEDHETRQALKFMDSFYKYDKMRESGKIKGTGARPDMKLAMDKDLKDLFDAHDAYDRLKAKHKSQSQREHKNVKRGIGAGILAASTLAAGYSLHKHRKNKQLEKEAFLGLRASDKLDAAVKADAKKKIKFDRGDGFSRDSKPRTGYAKRFQNAKSPSNSNFSAPKPKLKAPDPGPKRVGGRPNINQSNRDTSLNFRELKRKSFSPQKPKMSTGKKVGIGLGVAGAIGAAGYAANKLRKKDANPQQMQDRYEG